MRGYWSTLWFMVLTFLGTFYMQTFLNELWELQFLFVGIVFAVMVLAGIAMEKPWANALRTIFFATAIGNLALVFFHVRTGHFVFLALLLINIIALISSLLDEPEEFDFENDEFSLNTSPPPLLKIESLLPPPSQTPKKTTVKKKSVKQKVSKKKQLIRGERKKKSLKQKSSNKKPVKRKTIKKKNK